MREAYKNTGTVEVDMLITKYLPCCKACGRLTPYKGTNNWQILGNCQEREVICECGKLFIMPLHKEQAYNVSLEELTNNKPRGIT